MAFARLCTLSRPKTTVARILRGATQFLVGDRLRRQLLQFREDQLLGLLPILPLEQIDDSRQNQPG